MPGTQRIIACRLGNVPYVPTWNLQKRLQAHLIAAKRRDPNERPDHLMLLVEHPHVYTLGKSGQRSNLLASETELQASGATFEHIDRGGDITYHGPGQLVAYPILDLDRFFTDVHRYLRELEETVIRTCAEFGVIAGRIAGRTGVWIESDSEFLPARKICAMGIRCSRWVTMHGLGFNVNTDLDRYRQIIPCGIQDGDVTSLARETGSAVAMHEVELAILHHMRGCFSAEIEYIEGADAASYLESISGAAPIPHPIAAPPDRLTP